MLSSPAPTDGPTVRKRLWLLLRLPVGVLLALASITLLLSRAPRRQQPGWSWTGIGAGVALTLWVLFTYLLSVYVEQSASFGSTYGPLTGIVALVLWAYLTSMALFLGIAFSAQLEAVRAGVMDPERGDPEQSSPRASLSADLGRPAPAAPGRPGPRPRSARSCP